MSSSSSKEHSKQIAVLNDTFRQTFTGGKVYVTASLNSLDPKFVQKALHKVRTHDQFDRDNDPYGERDFGSISLGDQKIFWKIDYYAPDMVHGSEDPADPEITRRVLTVMLADEY